MTTLEQAIENFDYSSLFTDENNEKIAKEIEIENKEREQKKYAEQMNKYSMEIKDHTTLRTCKRCQGTGEIKSYRHVANGVCFTCGGYGKK